MANEPYLTRIKIPKTTQVYSELPAKMELPLISPTGISSRTYFKHHPNAVEHRNSRLSSEIPRLSVNRSSITLGDHSALNSPHRM